MFHVLAHLKKTDKFLKWSNWRRYCPSIEHKNSDWICKIGLWRLSKPERMLACRRPLLCRKYNNWDWLKYNLQFENNKWIAKLNNQFWFVKKPFASFYKCIDLWWLHRDSVHTNVSRFLRRSNQRDLFKFCWNCSNETNE